MQLNGVEIGSDSIFFIAEAGVNHNGDRSRAEELIDVAAESGADAVKFQTFNTERLVTHDAAMADYQTENTEERSQYEMLKQYEFDREVHKHLFEYCKERGIMFLSTPFDSSSANLLADLGVPAIKIGSGELDNHPLLEHIAEFGLPMIVSTGMGTMDEVHAARDAIRSAAPNIDLIFLHCTSTYPCSPDDVHLRAMETMASELPEPVGYSDHTMLPEIPAFAVAAGAHVVEKHFTLDSSLPGPDHGVSLEPDELARSIEMVKTAARVRGRPEKQPTDNEMNNMTAIRRSLHAATTLPVGTRLKETHIRIVRPAEGLSPRHFETVVGALTTTDLDSGDPITADDIDTECEVDK